MDKTHIKQKVILSAVAGMILVPWKRSSAFLETHWDSLSVRSTKAERMQVKVMR